MCWENDLYSLPKELALGEVHNLVVVTATHHQMSLPEAIQRVARQHEEEMGRFLSLLAGMPRLEGDARVYVDGAVSLLQQWIRGNLDWSKETIRYGRAGALSQ